jgi:MerR family mercuric resistance operon transcriptional regulator
MSDHVSGSGLQRAELARRTGCNLETIRYYEKIGLMPDPPRTAAGYRVYGVSHVSRLRFILRARELGFPIEELRSLLSMVDAHDYTCGDIHAMTTAHLKSVRDRIRDLQRLERTLSAIAERCSGDAVPECPIIDEMLGE